MVLYKLFTHTSLFINSLILFPDHRSKQVTKPGFSSSCLLFGSELGLTLRHFFAEILRYLPDKKTFWLSLKLSLLHVSRPKSVRPVPDIWLTMFLILSK